VAVPIQRASLPASVDAMRNGVFMINQDRPTSSADHPSTFWKNSVTKKNVEASARYMIA
jgi:hypothetical protein